MSLSARLVISGAVQYWYTRMNEDLHKHGLPSYVRTSFARVVAAGVRRQRPALQCMNARQGKLFKRKQRKSPWKKKTHAVGSPDFVLDAIVGQSRLATVACLFGCHWCPGAMI